MESRRLSVTILMCVTLLAFGAHMAYATPTALSGVPSYTWTRGCAPTAGGQLLGYWDANGYSNLFDASGTALLATANVSNQIASTEHIADYWGADAPLPHHADNCIADFMGTSLDPLSNGGTWISNIGDGVEDYADYRGYDDWSASDLYYSMTLWDIFVAEIDLGRPVLLGVDSSGDGDVDHSITGIGYEDRGTPGAPDLWYGCHRTWDEAEGAWWYQWAPVSSEYPWGVYNMTSVLPGALAPIPEPASLALLVFGVVGLAIRRRLRNQ